MDELHGVFRDLPPPPGGLARLRGRIGRRRIRVGWWLVVAGVVAVLAWIGRPPAPAPLEVDAGLLALVGPAPAGLVALDPGQLGVQPVAEGPGVRMYRVGGR